MVETHDIVRPPAELSTALAHIGSATASAELSRMGIRSALIRGPVSATPGLSVAGPAPPFHAVAAESGSDVTMLRDLFQSRVTSPCQERILALAHRRSSASGTTLGPEFQDTMFATVGPAMLMYHCVSGQDRSTDAQIESIVDTVLLPLVHVS